MTKPSVLFLCHRIPFPPDKGDKIRSYNIFRFLCEHYRVFLGTFYDDLADRVHASTVTSMCEGACVLRLNPTVSRLSSLSALVTGTALTLPYYYDRHLVDWVRDVAARERFDHVFVFSSGMAQYAFEPILQDCHVVVDFVDVDSDKWLQYASQRWLLYRWMYRREARYLAAYEKKVARYASCSVLVSESEAALFRERLGDHMIKVEAVSNGVDTDYFTPTAALDSPYLPDEIPIVFTGAMDYWPNVDAVQWFAKNIWPRIQEQIPNARFYIVGHNPSAAVQKLQGERIEVTGRVNDIRPYVLHAGVAIAPMRIARGIQNKVLEALALGKKVVTTSRGLEGIEGSPENSLRVANRPVDFADTVIQIAGAFAREPDMDARNFILNSFSWKPKLEQIKTILEREQELP